MGEFFVALEKERGRGWVVCRDGGVRSVLRPGMGCCPLTAVVQTVCGGVELFTDEVNRAAALLRMVNADARDVAIAADLDADPLRARILAALGLPAEAP